VPAAVDPDVVPGFRSGQLSMLISVLRAEEGLAPVWNWQRNGVAKHIPVSAGDGVGGLGSRGARRHQDQ
jgi:hypothetical protein